MHITDKKDKQFWVYDPYTFVEEETRRQKGS